MMDLDSSIYHPITSESPLKIEQIYRINIESVNHIYININNYIRIINKILMMIIILIYNNKIKNNGIIKIKLKKIKNN